jgi:hypothetical protein
VARPLPAVNVKDLAGHELGRFEVEDRVHDIVDLAHASHRVERIEQRSAMSPDTASTLSSSVGLIDRAVATTR